MIDRVVTKRKQLTAEELKKLRRSFEDHKYRVLKRKPDRTGHVIQMSMTFAQWLSVWLKSGKLHLRGRGGGKFCMARNNDLGDYEVSNVSIKSWEENSREAKLGKPGLKGRVSPTKGMKVPRYPCSHCGALRTNAVLARHHGPRCKNAPL